ncbi:aldo/keto reductase [Kiritimatiellota bacterium B12222]|nr:aldo/keto reductase [Kiritimatiellota bacterium B12222]
MITPVQVPTRRFGRTELQMPVFSTGGMRYQQDWKDLSPEEIQKESTQNVRECVQRSLAQGIPHIETARGYGSSEAQLGEVFGEIPREKLIVQTKIGVGEDLEQFKQSFETSMGYLKLDHVDLLSIHGINTHEELARSLEYAVPQMLKWREQGRIRFLGFSTHGPADVIMQAAFSGCFDYMNVHWYFVNHDNWSAIQAAVHQDMGIFIISPNDKGGRLWEPTPKMVDFCSPLHPMQFNAMYCLSRPEVHTLSLGVSKASEYELHMDGLKWYDEREAVSASIAAKILKEVDAHFVPGWHRTYAAGIPTPERTPGGIHIREILRLYTWAKSMDMVEFAKARYNMFGNAGAWFAGEAPGEFDDAALYEALAHSPHRNRILPTLHAAHEMLKGEEVKRQSESEKETE